MSSEQHRHSFQIGSWPLGTPDKAGYYRDLATAVESFGFDTLFHGDHMFPYNPNMEVLTLLAYWAATTSRIRLGPGVLLLPLRDPVVTAKELATIDFLSEGRLSVGVGVGGEIEQEWRAMWVDPASRGARCDEYLEIMRRLWREGTVDFQGRFRTVEGVEGSPKPHSPSGPPILVGGRTDAALRRALRHQGWFGYILSPRRVRQSIERLRSLAGGELPDGFRVSLSIFCVVDDSQEAGRRRLLEAIRSRYRQDFTGIADATAAFGTPDDIRARAEEYWDAGVDDLVWCPQVRPADMCEQASLLAETFSRH